MSKKKFPSELRYDLVGQDWVLIATGRAKRPEMFKKDKRQKEVVSKKQCPFCDMSTQEKPVLAFNNSKEVPISRTRKVPEKWTTIVIPNKYPAVIPGKRLDERTEGGIHKKINAIGFHEVIVTLDHHKQIANFTQPQMKELIDVYQSRYKSLMNQKFVNSISIFHNHGKEAGASIAHPHSQLITTPLVDVGIKKALENSKKFFEEKGKCVYCHMNEIEKRIKSRIIFENDNYLVICPFASKVAFEIIISPKKHLAYFEEATQWEKQDLAEAFGEAISKLYKGLNDPAYNFYLHTAPCDGKRYPFYHWHWTILPKTSIPAGFEFGTGIEISTIEPEKAAEYLRKLI